MAIADVANTPRASRGTRAGKVLQVLICLAALGVLAENVLLVRQNRDLQEAIAPQIVSGARLEMVGGMTLDGQFQSVLLPRDSKLLVITFSPGCPACQANQAGWAKLAAAAEQKGIDVLWLSRDPVAITRDYCLKQGIQVSHTLADPPHGTYQQLGLARVPNTVLVGTNGTVEKVWAGRLEPKDWETAIAYFGSQKRSALE